MKGQKNVVETSAHPPDPSPNVAHGHVAVYSPSAVTCGHATILRKVGRNDVHHFRPGPYKPPTGNSLCYFPSPGQLWKLSRNELGPLHLCWRT